MSVIYSTATKTARMTAVVTTIGTSGKLKLFSAADALLATFTHSTRTCWTWPSSRA